jgi:hypothetical protein
MRYLLLSLITLVAITALCSGLLLMYEPNGRALSLPLGVLDHSPFPNFFAPGLILTVVVGGPCFVALLFSGNRDGQSYRTALYVGLILIGWVISQMLLTQYFHWLQLLYLIIGLLIVLLSYQLMGKAAF